MGMQTGSALIRRQLGRRLRELREAAGKTLEDVHEAQIASPNTTRKIETGRTAPKVGMVMELARFYGADPAATEAVIALAEGARTPGWWEDSAGAWPEWLRMYIGLESAACVIWAYEQTVVHGLLQTEDYARALIGSDAVLQPAVVQQRAEFRVSRRQAVLDRPDPAHLELILAESALLLGVGTSATRAEQRAFLMEMNARPNVTIRVIPATAPPRAPVEGGTFTILDFDDPDDPDVAYIEHHVGSKYMDQPDQVAQHRKVFGLLRESSIPIEEYLK